jgi:hypothetical protein
MRLCKAGVRGPIPLGSRIRAALSTAVVAGRAAALASLSAEPMLPKSADADAKTSGDATTNDIRQPAL